MDSQLTARTKSLGQRHGLQRAERGARDRLRSSSNTSEQTVFSFSTMEQEGSLEPAESKTARNQATWYRTASSNASSTEGKRGVCDQVEILIKQFEYAGSPWNKFWTTDEERGVTINFSSAAAHGLYARTLCYGPSKVAVAGITRSMADFLGPSGIRVNSISA
ncbi:hypothetical protein V1504DRAFT_436955 [Lipomyces starkeyi]